MLVEEKATTLYGLKPGDLHYDFQQAVEQLRRATFLAGNTGGISQTKTWDNDRHLLRWQPWDISALQILDTCNASCGHCYLLCSPSETHRLSAEEVKRISNYFEELGLKNPDIYLYGGEVLLHPQLIQIVRENAVTGMVTNAATMNTLEKARQFAKDLRAAFLQNRQTSKFEVPKMPDTFEERMAILRTQDTYQRQWSGHYYSLESLVTPMFQKTSFRLNISCDELHMNEPGLSVDKVANMIVAFIEEFPEAELHIMAIKDHYNQTLFSKLPVAIQKLGFIMSSVDEGKAIEIKSAAGNTTKITVTPNDMSRCGRALLQPEELFAREIPDKDFDRFSLAESSHYIGTIGIDARGDVYPSCAIQTFYGPLVFGNVLQESLADMMHRFDKDPLFRSLVSKKDDLEPNAMVMLILAEEFSPGIVNQIVDAHPGDITSFYLMLLSNPERKLYITYRLQQLLFRQGILHGENRFEGWDDQQLKAFVIDQVAAVRKQFGFEI